MVTPSRNEAEGPSPVAPAKGASSAGKKRLPVTGTGPGEGAFQRRMGERWLVVSLSLVAAGLYAWSYFLPWWKITLYAPQYPKGLWVSIWLNRLEGEVHEISLLNHYIGMASLDDAAVFERQIAAYAIIGLGVAVLALAIVPGRRLSPLLVLAGAAFPVGFVADSFYWLHRFGHELNPKAPLHFPPFTPKLYGLGEIGQFATYARPLTGFYVALAGVLVLTVAVLVRRRVCAVCGHAGKCGAVCPRLFVGPGAGLPGDEAPSK